MLPRYMCKAAFFTTDAFYKSICVLYTEPSEKLSHLRYNTFKLQISQHVSVLDVTNLAVFQADWAGEHPAGTYIAHSPCDMEPSEDRAAGSRLYLLR
jgi:hypothetical protein